MAGTLSPKAHGRNVPPPQQDHLPSLDGWRGISIILVLVSHLFAMRGAGDLLPYMGTVDYGRLGVRMFFTISGFLITYLLLQEHRLTKRISLKAFYIRRTLRIWPAYFAYLLVLAVLTVGGLYTDSASSWIGSLTFTRNLIGQGRSLTGHLWSLGVEEQFYLLWPLAMIFLIRSRRAFYGTLAALCLTAVFARTVQVSFPEPGDFYHRVIGPGSPLMFADSLAVGCIAARLMAEQRARMWLGQFQTAILAVAMAAASWRGLVLAQAVIFAALMLSTIIQQRGVIFWLLNSRPLVTIGILSYSLYIWHFLFLSHYAGATLSAIPIYHWSMAVPAIFIAATASYFLIERPLAGLRSRFKPLPL